MFRLALLCALCVSVVDPASAAEVPLAQEPLPPGAVAEVGGFLGQRLKANERWLAKHQEARPAAAADTPYPGILELLEQYRATGDKELLRGVMSAWAEAPANRSDAAGDAGDTCAAAAWLEANQRLLEATGDAAHADAIERLLWNGLLAAQASDGSAWRGSTPLSGWKPEGGPECCSASGSRILATVPSLLYGRTRDGIAVNHYAASTLRTALASGTELTLRQATDYPAGETVELEISPARPERFALRLRLPAWCERPAVAVNGQALPERPERNATYVAIAREWRQGDRVAVALPTQARWVAGRQGNEGRLSLRRGPLVYALDTAWCDAATRAALLGDAQGEPLAALSGLVPGGTGILPVGTQAGSPSHQVLGPAFRVRIALADGSRALATMLPFANVRATQPGARDAYAVWLPEATSGRFRPVDLAAVANVHSNNGRGLFLSPARSADCFPFERYGAYAFRGIPFEVIDPARNEGRNLLILRGGPPEALAARYPASVTVPVGFRCRALHVLGGVGGWAYPSSKDRKVGASVRIRYDDAPSQEVQWLSGEHLADYNAEADVPGSARILVLRKSHLRLLRIPTNPDSKITQVEISTATTIAPVVAALTAELPEE